MLTALQLKPMAMQYPGMVPALLKPLVNAYASGQDITPMIVQIAKTLGFDNFMHGVSLSLHPNAESHSFVFTTLPSEWVRIYDQRAYLEVDPRIQFGIESSLPFIWDQASTRGKSPVTDAFLDAAAEHGVASGISISLRDSHARGSVTALSSANPVIDNATRERITEKIGDIMAFGQYFHELFITNILDRKLPPTSRGAPLSARERQCLLMSANGLTSTDIGAKLGISERTANFHFTNIISKLGVLNRKEAVARAVAQGLIHMES